MEHSCSCAYDTRVISKYEFAGFPRSWVAPHDRYSLQNWRLLMAETVDVSHIMLT